MKGLKHIKSFNGHQENLNISDVSESKSQFMKPPYEKKFLNVDVVDKRIRRRLFFDDEYYVTLKIDSIKGDNKIKEYQLEQNDYYKLDIGKNYRLAFGRFEDGWYLMGSLI